MNRDFSLSIVISAVVLSVSIPVFIFHIGVDLIPAWIAAKFVAAGQVGQIYPPLADTFSVRTPEAWDLMAAQTGVDGPVLAYIYPPLWAWLISPLTTVISHATFQAIFSVIVQLSLLGMLVLAHRIARVNIPVWVYLGIGLLVFASGPYGFVVLIQNQPQALVSFLTLFAIERGQAGHAVIAGVLLGLATAMKVSPIMLLPALMALGGWRPVLAGFLGVGGGLGILSILGMGWDIHRNFLSLLQTISATIVLSEVSFTVDALVAQLTVFDRMEYVDFPYQAGSGWFVLEKGPIWKAVSLSLLVAMAVWPVWAVRRGFGPLVWPTVLIGLALASSIAWSFYFLAPLAFLPALLGRLGALRGGVACIILLLPGSYLMPKISLGEGVLLYADQALGVAMLGAIALLFLFLARKPEQPLHPDRG